MQLGLDFHTHLPNLLPCDGEAEYYGPIFPVEEANFLFQALQEEIHWEHDEVVVYGKRHVTARQTAWHGDRPWAYTYSNSTKVAQPWSPALLHIKARVEALSQATYNACLLNLYVHGGQGMGWHSDDEHSLQPDAAIASVSLGAERHFDFKHRRQELKARITLQHGSLLVMRGVTQRHWVHALPKMLRVQVPRINLTFRTMKADRP